MVCKKLDGSTVGFGVRRCGVCVNGVGDIVNILSDLEVWFGSDCKAGEDGASASTITGLASILRFALASWERFAATTLGSMMKYTCSLTMQIFPCKCGNSQHGF